MIIEIVENGIYKAIDNETNKVLCTITSLSDDVYRAINSFTDITAEIKPIDDYKTYIRCITNKRADKNGHFRKTNKLAEHNTNWLCYMLQEKGFIRKALCIN